MSFKAYQPIIKICGIKTPKIAQHCIDAGADMLGFVFFEKSPRHLELKEIKQLIDLVHNRAETVILSVNPSDKLVRQIDALKPNWLQLHGNESLERVKEIRSLTDMKIIKALPVGSSADVKNIKAFYAVVDRIILDAKPPKNASRPGGLGKAFDWGLLKMLDPSIKFMLSGGLNDQNVSDAVINVRPFGLDVSSGVEKIVGEKDEKKILDFINNALNAAKKLEK